MKTITNILALFFISITYGQEAYLRGNNLFEHWTLGVKGGFNISGLFGDLGDDEQVFYLNAHVGGIAERNLNEEWAIALEPHLSVVGRRQNDGFERITYLNIPVLAKYQLPDNFTVDGGLHLGVKIAELREVDNGSRQRINRFKRIAPGLTLGTTYNMDRNWFAQLRMNYKISDVIRDDAGDTEGTSILTFQLSIGYAFGK